MSNKPMVICPHCQEHIDSRKLPSHRKRRNEFGIDIFECPECKGELKIEPSEYMLVRQGIENGNMPEGSAIQGMKVNALLSSEGKVLDSKSYNTFLFIIIFIVVSVAWGIFT